MDPSGGACITGSTRSTDFPMVNALDSTFNGGNNDAFAAYLRRTIVNLHTSGLRRRRLERDWLSREGPAAARRVTSQPDVGARLDLWEALRRLPARQRAALVLRYYEDLSERETSEVLGCSVAAVKSLVARGGETLRELVRGEEA